MARRRRKGSIADGIVGGGAISMWGFLLTWMSCQPVFWLLVLLHLVLVVVMIYAYFKRN